jgi:hypothetical protein
MARRGTFGRAPRAQSDLSSVIASIGRAMQAARDSNIMDAWKNGGTFEGQTIEDDEVLAYWRERMSGLDKEDPEYDSMKNNIEHLEYNIAQSKADLAYRQAETSPANDRRMAQFYLDWAKKVDRKSEFYRELQKDAAQFIQSAKARARAGAGAAATTAYETERDRILTGTQAGALLTQVLTQMARDAGIIGLDENLMKMRLAGENDPGRMEALLRDLNARMKADPAAYKGLTDALKAADPNFDGTVTSDYYAQSLRDQHAAFESAAALAKKTNHKGDADTLTTSAENTNFLANGAGAWDSAESYQKAFDARQAVFDDPTSSDEERRAAGMAFADTVDKIADDPTISVNLSTRMHNDAAASRGDRKAGELDSVYTNFSGLKDVAAEGTTPAGGEQKGVNAKIAAQMELYRINEANFKANPGAFTYATIDDAGHFALNGKRIGVVPIEEVANSPLHPQFVAIPQSTGGTLMVAVGVQPIIAKDASGEEIVGYVASYQSGGVLNRLYRFTNPEDGQSVWTPDPPTNPGAVVTFDDKGMHVDVTGLPGSFATSDQGKKVREGAPTTDANGTAYQDVTTDTVNANGELIHQTTRYYGTISGKGVFTRSGESDQGAPAIGRARPLSEVAFDTSRMVAGGDNNTDFLTTTVASIGLLPRQEAYRAANDLYRNPQFTATLDAEEWQSAGGGTTYDQTDPNYAKYQAIHNRNQTTLMGTAWVFNDRANLTNPAIPGSMRARASEIIKSREQPKGGPSFKIGGTIRLPNSPANTPYWQGQTPNVNPQTGQTVGTNPFIRYAKPAPSETLPSPQPTPIAPTHVVHPTPIVPPAVPSPLPAPQPTPIAPPPSAPALPGHDQYDPLTGRLRVGGV